jgi:hypothetical protein
MTFTTSFPSAAGHVRFPGGRWKALVMSYDDGSEHDRRLVEIFDRHGIRGTFHINSARLDAPHHVRSDEVARLYRKHEVAAHTATHPDLTHLAEDAVRREIEDDRQRLQALTERPVRGFAYPFGTLDDRIVRIAHDLGLAYARTAASSRTLAVPQDLLRWAPTCHHVEAMPLAETFLAAPAETIALLCIFGHSYELDGFMTADASKDWRHMEALCRLLQGHAEVWYAAAVEVADYLRALARVEWSATRVHNASATTLWISVDGEDVPLAPGASLDRD